MIKDIGSKTVMTRIVPYLAARATPFLELDGKRRGGPTLVKDLGDRGQICG